MVILEREVSEQIGEGSNMCVVRGGHFWQLGSIASLAAETSSILAQTSPQKRSQSACLILKIFLGEHVPRPS